MIAAIARHRTRSEAVKFQSFSGVERPVLRCKLKDVSGRILVLLLLHIPLTYFL